MYVNNYEESVALTAVAAVATLSLPDGEYRLTLSDAGRTRWEIVDATVTSGAATLIRARENTTAQAWPAGSVIYCAVTAEQLNALLASIADLTTRVDALEAGGASGYLADSSGNALADAAGNTLTTGA